MTLTTLRSVAPLASLPSSQAGVDHVATFTAGVRLTRAPVTISTRALTRVAGESGQINPARGLVLVTCSTESTH
jgi:hypothetical protein